MEKAHFLIELERLVVAFRKNRTYFTSAAYDESSLRNDFLTPFWRALGWDVENRQGLTQQLREVQVETRIEEAGTKKRADYLFRTDGIDRFVCEAKKPSADLKKHGYQAQRYAFNLRLLVTTLGNFDELQVFIVGGKPEKNAPWATYPIALFCRPNR
jgi:type I site-specific restriction endonuclease